MAEATVYRLFSDVMRFQFLLYDVPEDGGLRLGARSDFFGDTMLEEWRQPPVYIDNLRGEAPDVWELFSLAFVFTPDVVELLEPWLSMAGELLPLRNTSSVDPERKFLLLNVLNVCDCIDMSRSDFDRLWVLPDFIEHRLGEPTLFIVPQLAGDVFCVEWDDCDDSFKQRVDRLGLTGLVFEQVWSSATGPEQLNLMGDNMAPLGAIGDDDTPDALPE